MEQKFGKNSILGQAMMPCRVWRVSGEELFGFFRQSIKNMELRAVIGEHMLNQFKARYQDFPANAMSCCYGVVPALLSILTYKTSPRSSASPLTI